MQNLWERLQQRDSQALGELYDCYGRHVFLTILSVVRDAATAEDLSQETFLKAWTHSGTFDPTRGGLRPWLLAMARNRALDYVRSLEGRMAPRAVDLEDVTELVRSEGFERDLVQRDQVRAVRRVFDTLPANHRLVLDLAFCQGLSHTEIAARIKKPLGTVKSWVRTALRTVRTELACVEQA